MRYAHASEEFERFLVDARDSLGLTTRHQTYTAVQAVLWAFRWRLEVRSVAAFARFLPPVLAAIFLQEWEPDVPPRPFGEPEDWIRDVKSVRPEHNFAPDDAIAEVAGALRRQVDPGELERVLRKLPPEARRFWASPTDLRSRASLGAAGIEP